MNYVICHDRFFVVEYYFNNQLSFIGSAYFDTEESANRFAVKFCQSRPGHQFKLRPIYFMPAECV